MGCVLKDFKPAFGKRQPSHGPAGGPEPFVQRTRLLDFLGAYPSEESLRKSDNAVGHLLSKPS